MQRLPTSYALRARYVFSADRSPLSDGVVFVDQGVIRAIERDVSGPVIELGNIAILPGLVNAHAHLEFSDLDSPLGEPGIPFVDWIRLVIQSRGEACRSSYEQRVHLGLQRSARYGTTTIGEIATSHWKPPDDENLEVISFQELICTRREGVADATNSARQHLENRGGGLSPHAPYSVHPQLWQQVVALSRAECVPIATHLAESTEEIKWLHSGGGPLADFLAEGQHAAAAIGQRPLDYLAALEDAHRTLLIHGNYLNEQEIRWIARHADRFSVVYCPRTHAYFGHARYPLEQFLSEDINVALGTDGCGSSPDLSVLSEMRHVASRYPHVPLDSILAMGTTNGAKALGRGHSIGSILPGYRADLALVRLPDEADTDPYELLLHREGPVVGTIFRGQISFVDPSVGELA
ncbi:MAG: amidohydrolase family protein [Planctomycetales bacterium]